MPESKESLTRAMTRGGLTMLATSGVTMGGSLLAQVALGWFLSDGDFGVYALSIGFSTFLLVFKDGGVRLWLTSRNRDQFNRSVGDAFWVSLGFSVLVSLVLAGAAPMIGRIYDEPGVVPVIVVLALAAPLGAYPQVTFAWLQVDHRFMTLARIEVGSAALRYGLMIALAFVGLGPLAFALPVVAVNVFQAVAGHVTTPVRPWRSASGLKQAVGLFRQTRWSMAGSLSAAALRQSDYVALGIVARTSVVGVYFFAYQFSVRLVSLFTASLRKVVVPVFATAASEPVRQRLATIQGATFLGLVAVPFPLMLAIIAAPLEQLLWRGRWETAVPAIQILSFVLPLHLLVVFLEMVTQSQGRFRLFTAVTSVRGVGLAAAAGMSGMVGGRDSATVVALVIGGYLFLSGLIEILFLAGRIGTPRSALLSAFMPTYLYAIAAASAVLHVSESFAGWSAIVKVFASSVAYSAAIAAGAAIPFRSRFRRVLPILRHARTSRRSWGSNKRGETGSLANALGSPDNDDL